MSKQYEVERKFLLKSLPEMTFDKITFIHQYYLENEKAFSDRVRRVEGTNGISYYRTQKFYKSNQAMEEVENEISIEEFENLKSNAISEIVKYRHITKVGEDKWEIDKLENVDLVLAEVEMVATDKNLETVANKIKSVELPPFIKENLIMEVSDMEQFSNKSLSTPI